MGLDFGYLTQGDQKNHPALGCYFDGENMDLSELKNKTMLLFEITDISELGNALMRSVNDKDKLQAFTEIVGGDLSVDWLQMVYQYYYADRKEKKQDYTPKCAAKLLSRLIGDSTETIDLCAGSGALSIQRWNEMQEMSYRLYEIDERVIPFLLFNLALRNITATVMQGDVLKKEVVRSWRITKGEQFGNITDIESAI